MKWRAVRLFTAAVAAVMLSTGVGLAESSTGGQQPTGKDPSVTVMTRNVYHGVNAEMDRVATAASFPAFLDATAAVYNGYHERNFPERAAVLAAEIEETRPDVVGLQEVVMVRKDAPPDGPATPAEEVSLDYLQILLAKLQARGLHYAPVVQSVNWDIEVPTALGFDLRHTDRVVTLIRTDGKSGLKVMGTDSGHFAANCELTTATGQQIEIVRGWTSVDLSV